MTAYQWCRDLGLSHQLALQVTRDRALFEYYAEAVRHIYLLVSVKA